MAALPEKRSEVARSTATIEESRPGVVTAAGVLVILQGLVLLALGGAHLAALYLPDSDLLMQLFPGEQRRVVMSVTIIPLAVLNLSAGSGLLRLKRYFWLFSVFCQGLALIAALVLYFSDKPWYAYLMMLNSIGMVIFLNYRDVQMPFRNPDLFRERLPEKETLSL